MKAELSIKLLSYFAPNCPRRIVARNYPRRIVRAEISCAELSANLIYNSLPFEDFFPKGILHGRHVIAYKDFEQENKHFSLKKSNFFKHWISIEFGRH